jgi:hypothetical protein
MMSRSPLLLALLLLAGCQPKSPEPVAAPPPPPTTASTSCEQLMQPFADALWDNNPQGVMSKLAVPVVVIHQGYEPGEESDAYELGPVQTSKLNTPDQGAKLFAMLAMLVSPKDGDLVPRPRESEDTSWDNTFVAEARAGDMRRCVLTMAVGDAEHVLIAGFDSSGNKIHALYWN